MPSKTSVACVEFKSMCEVLCKSLLRGSSGRSIFKGSIIIFKTRWDYDRTPHLPWHPLPPVVGHGFLSLKGRGADSFPNRHAGGFSLIELLAVLAILAILVSATLVSYHDHIIRVRRTDGQTALLHLAAQAEKYALSHPQHGYQGMTLTQLDVSPTSAEGFYQLEIISADDNHFLLAAVPIAIQKDKICPALAIDSTGKKGILQNGHLKMEKQCW